MNVVDRIAGPADLVLEMLLARFPDQEIKPDPKFPGYVGRCPLHEMRFALFFDKHGKPTSCAGDCSLREIRKALGDSNANESAVTDDGVFIMGKDTPKPILENIIRALSLPDWKGRI